MSYYVINGFPGIGKSYAYNWLLDYIANNNLNWVVFDSDSSKFSHVNGEINKDFPQNYIDHISKLIEDNKDKDKCIIFCSTHKEVLYGLNDNKICTFLVYPNTNLKYEYITRYKNRNSPIALINKIDKCWDMWMCDMSNIERTCRYMIESYVLNNDKYLTDIIFEILNRCGGE